MMADENLLLTKLDRSIETLGGKMDSLIDKINRMEVERAKADLNISAVMANVERHNLDISKLQDVLGKHIYAESEREKALAENEKARDKALNKKLVYAGSIFSFIQIIFIVLEYLK